MIIITKNRATLLAIIMLVFCSLSLAAETITLEALKTEDVTLPGQELALNQLLRLAFANNPAIKAAKEKWQGAIERYPQATEWPRSEALRVGKEFKSRLSPFH